MNLLRAKGRFLSVAISLALLSACTDIPDIKPFADATAGLSSALDKGYTHAEAQLATLQAENPDLEENAKDSLKKLRERWKPTKEAMNALVAYTDSLAALAEAGKTGKEAAKKLTDSFEGFYQAVGQLLPFPGLPAATKTAFEAIGAVNGVIAKMRAVNELKKAAEEASPAVSVIADVLSKNFESLEQLSRSAGVSAAAAVEYKNEGLLEYHRNLTDNDTRITKVLSLVVRYYGIQGALRAQAEKIRRDNPGDAGNATAQTILNSLQTKQKEVLDLIKTYDPGLDIALEPGDKGLVAELETRQKKLLADSKEYRAELTRIDPQYKVVADKIVEIDAATQDGVKLFAKGQEGIRAWKKTHDDLKRALEKKQRLSVLELSSIVKEIAESFNKGVE